MDKLNAQNFEMAEHVLCFEGGKSILLCKSRDSLKNVWVKKIPSVVSLIDVKEDAGSYYLSGELDEMSGEYIVVDKNDGNTRWTIPGRAYFHILFEGFLYIIFIDDKSAYYLLKVDPGTGAKIWHHEVAGDLVEYRFNRDGVHLAYDSGRRERVSLFSGAVVERG